MTDTNTAVQTTVAPSIAPAPAPAPVRAPTAAAKPEWDPSQTMSMALTPRTMGEAIKLAEFISASDFAPKAYQGNPGNVIVAMQLSSHMRMGLLQVMQTCAVINGIPKLYGDAPIAICRASPLCEWIREEFDDATMTATCSTKRRGDPHVIARSFSQTDAETGKLWGRDGPWRTYPKRMLQFRARSWCLRDAYPDALMGMEVVEMPPEVVHQAIVEQQTQHPRPIAKKRAPVEAPELTPQQKVVRSIRKAMKDGDMAPETCQYIAQDAIGFVPENLEDLSLADAQRLLDFVGRHLHEPGSDG